jgi:hypothetical protein
MAQRDCANIEHGDLTGADHHREKSRAVSGRPACLFQASSLFCVCRSKKCTFEVARDSLIRCSGAR